MAENRTEVHARNKISPCIMHASQDPANSPDNLKDWNFASLSPRVRWPGETECFTFIKRWHTHTYTHTKIRCCCCCCCRLRSPGKARGNFSVSVTVPIALYCSVITVVTEFFVSVLHVFSPLQCPPSGWRGRNGVSFRNPFAHRLLLMFSFLWNVPYPMLFHRVHPSLLYIPFFRGNSKPPFGVLFNPRQIRPLLPWIKRMAYTIYINKKKI